LKLSASAAEASVMNDSATPRPIFMTWFIDYPL
jgi:hypothetical protein